MTPDFQRVEELFAVSSEIESPVERSAYLIRECAGDDALRRRVESMLNSDAAAAEFFRVPQSAEAHVPEPAADSSCSDASSTRQGDVIGPYRLVEQLGEGGFGTVFVAEQTEPIRRQVALKIIKPGMDTREVIARFNSERQALAMMDHPNIAKVLDAGTTLGAPASRRQVLGGGEVFDERAGETPALPAGRPYFVMELVRGVRITDYCGQHRLATRERLELFIQVCHAIQHAHQKGIIHRDIKPSNILVTVGDPDSSGVPKVIDFGIAKAIEGRLTDLTVHTQLHQFIGTPAYISPEQAEGGVDVDTRSDIYSLGVLLYELLAGITPFDADELLAQGIDGMRKTIREKDPPTPSTRLTKELSAIVEERRKEGKSESEKVGNVIKPGGDTDHSPIFPPAHFPSGSRRSTQELQRLIPLLRGDLDWIVMKCLEKDRARRYETASGLAADLKRHLNNEPVIARPPSAAYSFQKAFRRNKLVFTAATAVALALVGGLWISTYQASVARRAQRAEQIQRRQAQQKQAEAEAERRRAETERERANEQAQNAAESRRQARRLLYAADMNLAQQALKLNDLGRARRLLDRHRARRGEEDLRGWEWRYLWRLTRSSALVTLTNRSAHAFSVNFSPDGGRLAVGWLDGRVDLWNFPGRRLVRVLTDHEPGHLPHVAFSPIRNLLAATSKPKQVTLYDLDSSRESILWRAPDQGAWDVRDLSFATDGSKLVIYAASNTPELSAAVWVVNVSSATIEGRHASLVTADPFFGAARLSPDNRRLYLAQTDLVADHYHIQCLDFVTGQELWQTEPQRDRGLSTLAISPNGRVLASGSGFADATIRVWDAETGKLIDRLEGHTGWVSELVFTSDGRRLISAATDQTIRIWDTSNWTETQQPLRGHADEIHAVATSGPAQLIASAGKDGEIRLWKADANSAADGYRRLEEKLRINEFLPLDHSRVLLLPPGQPPELVDLKRETTPLPLPQIGASTNVLGYFGSNLLCHWNGTNQILISEIRNDEIILREAISPESGTRPTGVACNPARQLLAWADDTSATSVYVAHLATPVPRIALKSDVKGLAPYRFSEDGKYLSARRKRDTLCVWNIQTGQLVTCVTGGVWHATFAAGGRVLIVGIARNNDHKIRFYDLDHPEREPRRVPGRSGVTDLAVSPDGALVASSTGGGLVRLFDPAKGEWIEDLHGHLNAVFGIAFSADGQRLISGGGGREAVKLWDVGTRQELLTLGGTGSTLTALWSADGDVILAGAPWQAWLAPSWEEIAAAEANEKTESKQP